MRIKFCFSCLLALATPLVFAQTQETHHGDIEESRVAAACKAITEIVCGDLTTLSNQPDEGLTQTTFRQLGTVLWRRSQQTTDAKIVDDRPLYWRRLGMKRNFKLAHAQQDALPELLNAFERASRGFDDLSFTKNADLNILITGFDPFGLHNRIDQSNPSGVAALSFDDLVITANGRRAELQSAMFPVRFADFDAGMVESVVASLLASGRLDAIVTISMGRDNFDLERFPGRRRSAQAPDNLLVRTGAAADNPLLPLLSQTPLQGPEFVEFTLPVAAMLNVQSPYQVNDNHNVATLAKGRFAAPTLTSLAGETAVSGSGGGYLSNEISYRSLRLVHMQSTPIAAGHIHTPRIKGADPQATHQITWQLRKLLEALVTELTPSS